MTLRCKACDRIMGDFDVRWNTKEHGADKWEKLCNKCYNISAELFGQYEGVEDSAQVMQFRGGQSKTLLAPLYQDNLENYLTDGSRRVTDITNPYYQMLEQIRIMTSWDKGDLHD